MAVDKPTVQFNLNQLRKEVVKPDPFRLSLSASKIVTFPDLNAMESAESDELLARIDKRESSWDLLDAWLSEKDAAALRAEKLSRAEIMHIIEVVGKYYQDAYGTPGEDAASAS